MAAVDRATRRKWHLKLEKAVIACEMADQDLHILIAEAADAGITQADIAYSIGGVSPSSIRAKINKGIALIKARALRGED